MPDPAGFHNDTEGLLEGFNGEQVSSNYGIGKVQIDEAHRGQTEIEDGSNAIL